MEKNPNRRIYGSGREMGSERMASTPASSSASLTSALVCSSPLTRSMLSRSISPDLVSDRHPYTSQSPFASVDFVFNKNNEEDRSVVRSPIVGDALPELCTRDCVFVVNEYGRDEETKSNSASWIPEREWSMCREAPFNVSGRKVNGGGRVDVGSPELTLEAFLDGLDVDNSIVHQQPPSSPQPQQQQQRQASIVGRSFDYFNGGGIEVSGKGVGSMSGRGRTTVREPEQQDIISQKREKRMVRNRESAAKSREKKQIYTLSLENKLYKLEVENLTLKQGHESQEHEWRKKRLKELKIIRPTVVERKRLQSQPQQLKHLKRSHSL